MAHGGQGRDRPRRASCRSHGFSPVQTSTVLQLPLATREPLRDAASPPARRPPRISDAQNRGCRPEIFSQHRAHHEIRLGEGIGCEQGRRGRTGFNPASSMARFAAWALRPQAGTCAGPCRCRIPRHPRSPARFRSVIGHSPDAGQAWCPGAGCNGYADRERPPTAPAGVLSRRRVSPTATRRNGAC